MYTTLQVHLDPIDVECRECEALAGQPCVQPFAGVEYRLHGVHDVRQDEVDDHWLHERHVNDSDVVVQWCDVCDYEDAV